MLALELEARGLGAKVTRAGVKAQNAGCVISKAQELINGGDGEGEARPAQSAPKQIAVGRWKRI